MKISTQQANNEHNPTGVVRADKDWIVNTEYGDGSVDCLLFIVADEKDEEIWSKDGLSTLAL